MQYQFVCKKYKLLDCGRDNGYNKVKTEKGLTIIMIKIVAKFNVQSNKKETFLKYAAELSELDDAASESADVNGDGSVDTNDAAQIMQYAAEKIAFF